MGNKNDTATPAAAIAEIPAPSEAVAPLPEAAAPVAKKKPAKKKPVILSTEEIALRAYFISEDRHRNGVHGDAHSDWVEAERQLKAEDKAKQKRKAKKKPARAKKRQ